MKIRNQIKKLIPEKWLVHYFKFKDRGISRQPKKIIEHMEVDFALSRVFDKTCLKVLDIGAHHGEFIDIFGTFNHWHQWQVFCVEPFDQNRRQLERKARKYKNVSVTVCPVGISDVTCQKTFYLGSKDTLFTCTENWNKLFPGEFQNSQEFKIDCLTISDLTKRYNINISENFDLVKIDVEGHDLHVIRSFCESEMTSTVIIFEISNDLSEVDTCIELLKIKGFSEFYIFGRTGIPTTYIGELVNNDQVSKLYKSGHIEVGNVVGFCYNTKH